MRVKRLEIQGFKSFKDKTVIHFDHGITGIVGPNGCGKSNIVDAFFWVMGEQSYKHMRGSSSDDLIFNGSSKYQALGLAEATLVLETDAPDADPASGASAQDIPIHLRAKEVSVTRRLYRTGDGEYFINGVQARLKDIQELFMDTGVGAKGYSVIEQGQIGKIVNAKPEERRLLVEEAAGIAKYKARKKESLRKMEATQANLSRLNDVIAEIERNLASLERQAQKARLYKRYKDELLDKEMTWGRRKTQVIRQKLETLRKEKDILEQELLALKTEIQVVENSVEGIRVSQLTDTKQAEDLQAGIQLLSDELTREQSALELSRKRQSDLENQLRGFEEEKSQLNAAITSETEKLVEREAQAQESEIAHQVASLQAQEMDENVRKLRQEADSERRETEAARRKLMSDIQQASDLSSRAASLQARMESAQAQAERLAQQVAAQEERLTAARDESSRASEAAETAKIRRDELQTERKAQTARVQEQEQALRQSERTRDESLRALTQVRSKLQSLEELAQAYEGFGEGPKAALEWFKARAAEGAPGKLIALTDVYEVDPGYEAALEGWLEGRLESLVTDEASLALQALKQLHDNKSGRVAIQLAQGPGAGAFGGSTVDATSARNCLAEAGFEVLGELSQYVRVQPGKFDSSAADFAARALGGVLVVRSLDPLAQAGPKATLACQRGFSLVAVDGNAFDVSGLLRGGSAGESGTASVLKRKRAIAELELQVRDSEGAHAELERSAADARQSLDLARARLQGLQDALQESEIAVAAADRDVHQGARALREAEGQASALAADADRARDEVTRAITERESVEAEMSAILSARSDLEAQVAAGDARMAEKDSIVRAQEAEVSQLRVHEASLRERASSFKRELESGRAMVADRQRRLAEIDRVLERALREREEYSGGESRLETRIAELVRELAAQRELYAAVKDRLEQAQAQLNEAHEKVKAAHKAAEAKSTGSTELAIETEKLASELQHLIQNLEEKYGPGCLERPVIRVAEEPAPGTESDAASADAAAPQTPEQGAAENAEATLSPEARAALLINEDGSVNEAPSATREVLSPIQEEMSEPVITAEMSAEEELALGEEVERLRERIRRLGEVNVMAIEEYEDTKKRFDHLASERQDLEHSIKNLEEAIEHINKTSNERFAKAFEAIADRFERLFPIIFGGGQARLSLVYPEGSQDILEAGVDILAQPPGKKIVNIGLLSGGEKALTAVSLIFAIFMVKPSPFCVLDEVDAPLDDANIGKFNALLREMSAKSQFILITHNKKTMELNDTLYGVTMEEPGVSKMVSIEMH